MGVLPVEEDQVARLTSKWGSAVLALALVSSHAAAEVFVTKDDLTRTVAIHTKPISLDNGCRGLVGCLADQSQFAAELRGLWQQRGDGQLVSHCLVVSYEGDQWAFFSQARDMQGVELQVNVLERRLGKTYSNEGVREVICVQLSRPYLDALKGNALSVRIEGRRMQMVGVPGEIVAEYVGATAGFPEQSTLVTRRVILGIQFQPQPQPDASTAYLVRTVAPRSLGERSGLRVGDVILAADGGPLPPINSFADAIQRWTPDKPGKLQVQRDGAPLEVTVLPP